MQEKVELTLHSVIKPALLNRRLLIGSFFAILGGCMLSWGGFFPVARLSFWGIPLFFLGGSFLTCGLYPYKKLKKLERKPDQLILKRNGTFIFVKNDKILWMIPSKEIHSVDYKENYLRYGLLFSLKSSEEVISLPFFSSRGKEEIEKFLF